MQRVGVFVQPLAVVKKCEQLHHQQVGFALGADFHAMQTNARPMRGAVIAIAFNFELRQHVLQQARAVECSGP